MANILGSEGLLHGGDYNPDQWLDRPDILTRDLELFDLAGINTVTLGTFAWAKLEPEQGRFELGWLREIVDRLEQRNIRVLLSTPSSGPPRWLVRQDATVLRVAEGGTRARFGVRQSACLSSPVFRDRVAAVDSALAREFAGHPALAAWHISNEYSTVCFCDLCQDGFRRWLSDRYHSVAALNTAWNTGFWGHDISDFAEVEAPSTRGEPLMQGLRLDWRRFVSDLTADFMAHEIDAVRSAGATEPTLTNFMYNFDGLDYRDHAKGIDVVSWDSYPPWHLFPDADVAADFGMEHDYMRSLKSQPFLLMEASPSATNWSPVSKLQKPGIHLAQCLQAVAHGSDSVLYFQMRQSRGGYEKFHGAVIDHYGGGDTRVFREVTEVGEALHALGETAGSTTHAEVAVLLDWQNRTAVESSAGPRNIGMEHRNAVLRAHRAFRRQGLDVDLIGEESDLDRYRIVAVPMGYMFRAGFADRLREFVGNGGILLMTYWSGVVDESDLTYLGPTPAGLTDLLGLRRTEIDGLFDGERRHATARSGNTIDLKGTFTCATLVELVETSTAEVLATYDDDFFAGSPAVTRNSHGAGTAYLVCADFDQGLFDQLARAMTADADIRSPLDSIPHGVEVTTRRSAEAVYTFIQNFSSHPVDFAGTDDLGRAILGDATSPLGPLGTLVLRRDSHDI